MCLFSKFSMPFFVKPASPVKSTQLLKKGSSSHCWWNCRQNSWHRQNQADLQLVPAANGMGRATVHGEPDTIPCTHVRQLQFNERWYGDSPLHVSMCSSTLPVCKLLHLPRSTILTEGWTVPVSPKWWPVAWNMGLEVCIEGTSPCTTLQLNMSTVKNYVHIGIFKKYVAVHFKHRFAKQLLVQYWKNCTWLHTQFTGNECLIYSSAYGELTNHRKHDKCYVLLTGQGSSDKRQVVIYIIQS
jgi:hypothetical protein